MKLRYKFFLAFLGTSFIIVVLLVGIMQIFVYRNFADFVNRTELSKLDELKLALASEYQKQNSWDSFLLKHDRFVEILDSKLPARGNKRLPPPRGLQRPFHDKQRPPWEGENDQRMMPPRHPDPLNVGIRLCLFDRDKKHIAGQLLPGDSFTFSEISLNSETIGWLGLKIVDGIHHPLESGFLKAQKKAFSLMGICIFFLAVLISYLLSRHLLSPVNELMKGTKAMSAFNFDTKINVDSKDELGKLADNFNQMAQTLKNSEEIRKNWISDISHELRTPIAILKGKVEALQDGIRKMTPETLDSLHADINRLQKLVEDLHLLSLADSETLHIKKEKIQPVRILNAILDDFQVRLDEAQIRVHIDFQDTPDSFFCGSKAHMERLFSNLIENSIRYTDASGHLKILCQKHQSFLQFVFEDSSPGVSEESLPLIFNRLYRDEKSRSRAHGGSGLGLSICSQIVENHQGTIHSDHSQEGGLKLTINLPLN